MSSRSIEERTDYRQVRCPECGYDLSSHLASESRYITCPECGYETHVMKLRNFNRRRGLRRLVPRRLRPHLGTRNYFIVVALIVLTIPIGGLVLTWTLQHSLIFGVSIYLAMFVAILLGFVGLFLE